MYKGLGLSTRIFLYGGLALSLFLSGKSIAEDANYLSKTLSAPKTSYSISSDAVFEEIDRKIQELLKKIEKIEEEYRILSTENIETLKIHKKQSEPIIEVGTQKTDKIPETPEGYKFWKTVKAKITAYCPCKRCCGEYADGKTSIGDDAWELDGVAVDPEIIPYRTLVALPGIGFKEADDTGVEMRKNGKKGIIHIDVRMASHEDAEKAGVVWMDVSLYRKKEPEIKPKIVENIIPSTHVIEKGDTLWDISNKYGIPVEDLKKYNEGIDENRLRIGYQLRLKPNEGDPTYDEFENKIANLYGKVENVENQLERFFEGEINLEESEFDTELGEKIINGTKVKRNNCAKLIRLAIEKIYGKDVARKMGFYPYETIPSYRNTDDNCDRNAWDIAANYLGNSELKKYVKWLRTENSTDIDLKLVEDNLKPGDIIFFNLKPRGNGHIGSKKWVDKISIIKPIDTDYNFINYDNPDTGIKVERMPTSTHIGIILSNKNGVVRIGNQWGTNNITTLERLKNNGAEITLVARIPIEKEEIKLTMKPDATN